MGRARLSGEQSPRRSWPRCSRREGFKVERGVAGIPTAFTATAGSGKPVIGILGEYDALPGLSQEAVPEQSPRVRGRLRPGCGHHLFGAASAAAAIAVAEQLKNDKLSGTVRFYGCPAEEGGAAKVFMVRDGLFKDCDAVLHWHPGSRNAAGDATLPGADRVRSFVSSGTSAHAGGLARAGPFGARRRRADEPRRGTAARAHARPDAHSSRDHGRRRRAERRARLRRGVLLRPPSAGRRLPQAVYARLLKCAEAGRWRPKRSWKSSIWAARTSCCPTTRCRASRWRTCAR